MHDRYLLALMAAVDAGASSTAAELAPSKSETAIDGLVTLMDLGPSTLAHPIPAVRIRASWSPDTRPRAANENLEPAIAASRSSCSEFKLEKMPGVPCGLNEPFERAIRAISGEATYYRWGPPSQRQKVN